MFRDRSFCDPIRDRSQKARILQDRSGLCIYYRIVARALKLWDRSSNAPYMGSILERSIYGIDLGTLCIWDRSRNALYMGSILERSLYGIDLGTLCIRERSWNASRTRSIVERSMYTIDLGTLRVSRYWYDPRTLN